MSYDLFFHAPDAPITAEQFERHFQVRPNYRADGGEALYENEDTGVYFVFYREEDHSEGDEGSQASFNINYYRPHFFGLEAALEVLAFVERFGLQINDPQMDGMGDGPFTRDGFVKGWNTGNLFAYQALESAGHDPLVYPTAGLEHAWTWNIHRSDLQNKYDELFVPKIFFFKFENRVVTATIWGDAMPILLPETDYVLVGRKSLAVHSSNPETMETCFVPWHEITADMGSFPVRQTPVPFFEVSCFEPPDSMLELVRAQQMVADGTLEMLRDDTVLNQELILRARKGPEEQQTLFE